MHRQELFKSPSHYTPVKYGFEFSLGLLSHVTSLLLFTVSALTKEGGFRDLTHVKLISPVPAYSSKDIKVIIELLSEILESIAASIQL